MVINRACLGHNLYIYTGIQKNFAQLLSLRMRSAVQNIYLHRLKVKVTLEGQMIKWS